MAVLLNLKHLHMCFTQTTKYHSVTLRSINCVDLLDAARLAIRDGTVKSCSKYFVSLPTTEAYLWYISQLFTTSTSYYCPQNIRICGRRNNREQRSIEHYAKCYLFMESHYDAIVSVTTGKVCLHHPTMLTSHSKLVDLTD